MDRFKQDINIFLVDAFNSLLQIEEDFLAKGPFKNITVKEMHLIDTVVNMKDNNIAKSIANRMNITQSSLTTAVSTLEKKGILMRKADEKDRRIVKIYPTEKAMQVYHHHQEFHHELVDVVTHSLSSRELDAFVSGLNKVREFFDSKKCLVAFLKLLTFDIFICKCFDTNIVSISITTVIWVHIFHRT